MNKYSTHTTRQKPLLVMRLLLFCVLGFSFLFSLTFAKPAVAQTELNLTVSPPVAYLHVPPGTNSQHTIILENSGSAPITVYPRVVDFTTDGKSGQVRVTNQLTFPYVSIGRDNDVSEVTIPAQKKAQLTLYLEIPPEVEEREYPLTVLFFSSSEATDQSSGDFTVNGANNTISNSNISGAIGSNLIVLVAKQNKFSKYLEVLDFQAPIILDSLQSLEFTPLVQNNSIGSISASGSAKIVNWKKETIAEFDIYPDTILGFNSRELRALLSNENLEQPEIASFKYKPTFLLGPYQIVLTLESEEGVITQAVHVFYALPLAILVAAGIGIGIAFVFRKK